MIKRLRKVTKGLYRGGALSPKDVKWLQDHLGIKKIVSLDKEVGETISRTCKLLGIDQIKLYISFDKGLKEFLDQDMKKLFLEGGPVFVGCSAGKDRTGLAIALVQCKYLGKSPEEAIKEAKQLGFGVGIPPKMTADYEKIIRSCKSESDSNHADIVSNQREYIGDNRDSFLDEGHQGSFAPFLDSTRTSPFDQVDNPINDQFQTRQNYDPNAKVITEIDKIPQNGVFNNDAGLSGAGPTVNMTGFIYD